MGNRISLGEVRGLHFRCCCGCCDGGGGRGLLFVVVLVLLIVGALLLLLLLALDSARFVELDALVVVRIEGIRCKEESKLGAATFGRGEDTLLKTTSILSYKASRLQHDRLDCGRRDDNHRVGEMEAGGVTLGELAAASYFRSFAVLSPFADWVGKSVALFADVGKITCGSVLVILDNRLTTVESVLEQ